MAINNELLKSFPLSCIDLNLTPNLTKTIMIGSLDESSLEDIEKLNIGESTNITITLTLKKEHPGKLLAISLQTEIICMSENRTPEQQAKDQVNYEIPGRGKKWATVTALSIIGAMSLLVLAHFVFGTP